MIAACFSKNYHSLCFGLHLVVFVSSVISWCSYGYFAKRRKVPGSKVQLAGCSENYRRALFYSRFGCLRIRNALYDSKGVEQGLSRGSLVISSHPQLKLQVTFWDSLQTCQCEAVVEVTAFYSIPCHVASPLMMDVDRRNPVAPGTWDKLPTSTGERRISEPSTVLAWHLGHPVRCPKTFAVCPPCLVGKPQGFPGKNLNPSEFMIFPTNKTLRDSRFAKIYNLYMRRHRRMAMIKIMLAQNYNP